jgi:hypothetical protein
MGKRNLIFQNFLFPWIRSADAKRNGDEDKVQETPKPESEVLERHSTVDAACRTAEQHDTHVGGPRYRGKQVYHTCSLRLEL